jgi:hypothetical protein
VALKGKKFGELLLLRWRGYVHRDSSAKTLELRMSFFGGGE